MERTKDRPTVTGKFNSSKVAVMGLLFIITGLILLALTTATAFIIGIIGVFSYVVVYSMWSKRQFVSNTIVGSISGAVPPLIGWGVAVDPTLDIMAWMLFLIMFAWQPPHFYALAMRISGGVSGCKYSDVTSCKGLFNDKKTHLFMGNSINPTTVFYVTVRKSIYRFSIDFKYRMAYYWNIWKQV